MTNEFSFNLCGVLGEKLKHGLNFIHSNAVWTADRMNWLSIMTQKIMCPYFVAIVNIKIIISLNNFFGGDDGYTVSLPKPLNCGLSST